MNNRCFGNSIFGGKFISFEGSDGSGKTTLVDAISRYFARQRIETITLREPGSTTIGEQIRSLLKCDYERTPLTDLFLFEASRSELVSQKIKPALKAHKLVLCDRFAHSSMVYQGIINGLDLNTVLKLNNLACQSVVPDLIVLLVVSEKVISDRLSYRHNGDAKSAPNILEGSYLQEALFEVESGEVEKKQLRQSKIQEAFKDLASKEPQKWLIVDSSKYSVSELTTRTISEIRERLEYLSANQNF